MKEVWKPIPPCPGYEASSLGRIRSLDRMVKMKSKFGLVFYRPYKGKILKPLITNAGYIRFIAPMYKSFLVHRAVCWTFLGEPPTLKHHAAHLDGNALNNKIENLAWVTASENCLHKKEHGTDASGSKNNKARLIESDIPKIMKKYLDGYSTIRIAKIFKVSDSTIRNIIYGITWRHIPREKFKRTKRRINISDANKILNKWNKGTSLLNIAEEFKMGKRTVQRILSGDIYR